MIYAAVIVSSAAAGMLLLVAGAWAAAVPCVGLAWTVLFARHSRRAAFSLVAVLSGVVEGILLPAPWTFWPIAFLIAGAIAFTTRRLLPIRGPAGEFGVAGVLAALVSMAARPFPPFGLPSAGAPIVASLLGAASTGAATAFLVFLAHRVTALRMRLQKPY